MFSINTNVTALRVQNAMRQAEAAAQKSMLRLSTGKRINSAADDPAGLAIWTRMNSDIIGMKQGIRNAQDGISSAQTAEGVLNEVTSMMQRIRELALQAKSGTYTDHDRSLMDAEVQELKAQITDSLRDSKFNGVSLFDTVAKGSGPGTPGTPGYGTSTILQVGSQNQDTTDLVTDNLDTTGLAALKIGTVGDADSAIGTVDGFLKNINKTRAGLGAAQSGLEFQIDLLNTNIVNLSDAQSRIMDVDYGAESVELAKAQICIQAGTAMLAQTQQMTRMLVKLLLGL